MREGRVVGGSREDNRFVLKLEIAERIYVSETTVKTHVAHCLAKLGVRDRVQALVQAYESGLVQPGES